VKVDIADRSRLGKRHSAVEVDSMKLLSQSLLKTGEEGLAQDTDLLAHRHGLHGSPC